MLKYELNNKNESKKNVKNINCLIALFEFEYNLLDIKINSLKYKKNYIGIN